MGYLVHIVILVVFLGLYCLPAIIAGRRRHPDQNTITLVSLLLGWTILAWIACMVWACNSRARLRA